MLDRYFQLESGPYNAEKIWQWVKNLNFHERKGPEQSNAVAVLRANTALRQGIIKIVFGNLTDPEEIFQMKIHSFDHQSHSGLGFHHEDHRFIVDHLVRSLED